MDGVKNEFVLFGVNVFIYENIIIFMDENVNEFKVV